MFGLGSPNKLGDRAHFIDVPYLLDSDVNIQTILPNGTLLIIFMECLEKVTVVKLVCQRDVYMAHPRSPPGRDPPGHPVRAPPRHGCLHRHHGPGHRLGRLDAATVITTGARPGSRLQVLLLHRRTRSTARPHSCSHQHRCPCHLRDGCRDHRSCWFTHRLVTPGATSAL